VQRTKQTLRVLEDPLGSGNTLGSGSMFARRVFKIPEGYRPEGLQYCLEKLTDHFHLKLKKEETFY
jgi:hypothetical protein